MSAYYNDHDRHCCARLRSIERLGLVPAGVVDERSVAEVRAADVAGRTQCHFFAGIGGWPYALRLAGWPDTRPVWTASLPCQPFSTSGKRKGVEDERHLWPRFLALVRECRPAVLFGEQVAAPLGREWLAVVRADLEGLGYAFGAADLPAGGVGAPHRRQRLWWGAARIGRAVVHGPVDGRGPAGPGGQGRSLVADPARPGDAGLVGHPAGLQVGARRERAGPGAEPLGRPGPWHPCHWIPCTDGRWRPVAAEPVVLPLAHGVSAGVGGAALIRGYGNAIVPALAAGFVTAFDEAMREVL